MREGAKMKVREAMTAALLGLIPAILPVHGFAFENEPGGFRGLAWGTPIGSVVNELTLISSDGLGTYYARKGDVLEMDGAKLESIVYRFYDGEFFGVALYAKRGSRYEFLEAFRNRYGPGVQPDARSDKYYWAGDVAEIILDCKKLVIECHAVIRSSKAALKEQADDAKNDTGS